MRDDGFSLEGHLSRTGRIVAGIALLAAAMLAGAGCVFLADRQAPASAPVAGAPRQGTREPVPTMELLTTGQIADTARPVPITPAPSKIGKPAKTPVPSPTEEPEDRLANTRVQPSFIPVIGGADKLAFLNENDIWIANLDGSGLRRLTEDGTGKLNLQWSPDGQAVHYISGECVQAVNIDTLLVNHLACFGNADRLEAFEISPDGQSVAISLDHELFVVPFSPEQLAKVRSAGDLQSMAQCASLAPYKPHEAAIAVKQVHWSRDGQRLAINRGGLADGRQVDLIQLLDISDCSGTIDRLDEFPPPRFRMDGYDSVPTIQTFTWDGEYLFALNSFKRNDGYGDLWVYSTELRRAYQFSPIGGGCCYRDPLWSPDGSHLLFGFQDRSQAPESLTRMYLIPYASLGTGMIYAPLPLPDDLLTDPRAKPMPALRPAR